MRASTPSGERLFEVELGPEGETRTRLETSSSRPIIDVAPSGAHVLLGTSVGNGVGASAVVDLTTGAELALEPSEGSRWATFEDLRGDWTSAFVEVDGARRLILFEVDPEGGLHPRVFAL